MLTAYGAMKLAIEEARKGLGYVAPNPPVGAVIVDSEGRLLSRGYHHAYGQDHAELNAYKNLERESARYGNGEVLKGATMYVTLEPCAHEGKTPSCAKWMAELPFKKVVYGVVDPNPLVRGQGLEILRAAGIEVVSAYHACELEPAQAELLQHELDELAEIFLYGFREQKTFVALKVATTLDGSLAHQTGESKWLTGERAREHVHYLRAQYDAVLVGRETFLRDNPSLDVRHAAYPGKKNKVIVLSAKPESFVDFIADSRTMKTHGAADVLFATLKKSPTFKYSSLVCESDSSGKVNLESLLAAAYGAGVRSIFVEGGASVASAFLREGLVHRLYQFIAPQIVGARSGINFTRDLSTKDLASRLVLKNPHARIFGQDVMVTGRLR